MNDSFNDDSLLHKFPKEVKHQDETFSLYMITDEFVFFLNLMESDDNGCTRMYDHDMNLVSNNYFATNEIAVLIHENQDAIRWVSDVAKYNMQQEGVWPEQNGLKI